MRRNGNANEKYTNSVEPSCAWEINRLTPNDPYMGRSAPLTSKRCILNIYSTNIGTEYFEHALYSPFFFYSKFSLFHNANLFGFCIIHILYTGCAIIKKIIPAPKVHSPFASQEISNILWKPFITIFITARHYSLHWARLIQFTLPFILLEDPY